MREKSQDEHSELVSAIRRALSALRLTRCLDEDIFVAMARLDNWLVENETRWVK